MREKWFKIFENKNKPVWQGCYTVLFCDGSIYETSNGLDALYICNVANLLYLTNTEAKQRLLLGSMPKHFCDYYADLLGCEVDIEEVQAIGVWAFIANKIEVLYE